VIAQQPLDLVALSFEAIGGGVAELSSPRATALLRLKSIVEAQLPDPALKPATAAQAAGMSVRYANVLLAQEGTSLERYIMLRRLKRSRLALMSPTHASRTISDIAYSYRFSDQSHFARRFREQFNCTPSEVRPKPR
jgi:AraC-like DNA-binding protein